MIFKAKNELQQYLTSINPIYAKYTESLWAHEVNSISQLGDASLTVLQACGIENRVHAGNIIAQSKATGKWSCSCSGLLWYLVAYSGLQCDLLQTLESVLMFTVCLATVDIVSALPCQPVCSSSARSQ